MPLFKKAACFTDIHFGMKGGSRTHNMDCEEFVKWFCEEAKAAGAETCIFLGDWHHNRATTDVSTMNYTVSNLERINELLKNIHYWSDAPIWTPKSIKKETKVWFKLLKK